MLKFFSSTQDYFSTFLFQWQEVGPCHHYEPLSSHSYEKNVAVQSGNARGRPKKEVVTSKIILAISNWVFIRNQTQAPTEELRPLTPADFDISIKLSSTVFRVGRNAPSAENQVTDNLSIFFDKNGLTVSYLALQSLLEDRAFTQEFMSGLKRRYDQDLTFKTGQRSASLPSIPVNQAGQRSMTSMLPPPPPPPPSPRPTSLPLFGFGQSAQHLSEYPGYYLQQMQQLQQQMLREDFRCPNVSPFPGPTTANPPETVVNGAVNNNDDDDDDDNNSGSGAVSSDEEEVVAKKKKAASVTLDEGDNDDQPQAEEGRKNNKDKKKAPSAERKGELPADFGLLLNSAEYQSSAAAAAAAAAAANSGTTVCAAGPGVGSRKRATKK